MKTHLVLFALLSFLSLAACAGGSTECLESCDDDSDCQSGLLCLNTDRLGDVCLPELCETCFSRSQTCNYERYTDEEGNLECVSPFCS